MQFAELGTHRFRTGQLATNEIALANEAGYEWGQWFVVEVIRRVPLLQATFLEDADMIAYGERFFLVVSYQNCAGTTAFKNIAYFMAETAAQLHIEVGEWLVEQQQLWLGCQRTGKGNSLLLAPGKLVRIAFAKAAELDQLEHFFNHLVLLRMLGNTEGDVLGDGQVWEQRVVLKHHTYSAFLRCQGKTGFGDNLAAQLYFTFVYRFETGDGAQGSGLAAARGAQQATNVAGIQVQV